MNIHSFNSESKELVHSLKLMNEGKYDKALEVLIKLEKNGNLRDSDQLSCYLLKSSLLNKLGNYTDAFRFAKQVYQKSLKLKNHLLSIDAIMHMAFALTMQFSLDDAFDLIIKCENLLKTFDKESSIIITQNEASIAYIKSLIYFYKSDVEQSLKYAEQSLKLNEELGSPHEIAQPLYVLGLINIYLKYDWDHAITYIERSQRFAEKSNQKDIIAYNLMLFGTICALKGETEQSLMHLKTSQLIFEELDNKRHTSQLFNIIANVYKQQGELEQALFYLEKGLVISEEIGNKWVTAYIMSTMIEIFIEKKDNVNAQKYLELISQLDEKKENKTVDTLYRLSKGLVLKMSYRTRDRAKAEELFKEIIKEGFNIGDITIYALVNLCDLFITELYITNDIQIIDELNPIIDQMVDITEKTQSFWVLAETYILQAKVALILLNLKDARRLLTQAQQIAEKQRMNCLAAKISVEHDKLLKELNMWEHFKDSEAPISERVKFAKLDEQIALMVQKYRTKDLQISQEEPIMILIITEGGTPIFSHSFIKEKVFESHLFGGFLTTIDYFIREMFSEGLDRAMFGEYTLLLKSVPPFFITYIFKGESYYAHQHLKYFIDHIREEDIIWQNLMRTLEINKSIHLKDIPLLESLITETFITKTIVSSES